MNKNSGFSLIELLVAIGISGIVLLMISFIMVQGTTLFKGENEVIDIQGELQLVRNQLSEALMGAKTVVVVDADDALVIYTGEINPVDNELAALTNGDGGTSTQTTERVITYLKGKGELYISSNYLNAVSEGNLISNFLTDMEVEFNKDCAKKNADGSIAYYLNPFSVDIKIKLTNGGHSSDVNMSVRVRNILKEVARYETDSRLEIIGEKTALESYKVK